MLLEFDIEIWDKKGYENVVADYLSRMIMRFASDSLPIAKTFLDEQLMHLSQLPWYADIVNSLVTNQMPQTWSKHDRLKFLSEARYFYWDDPYLFKYCLDQLIRDAS